MKGGGGGEGVGCSTPKQLSKQAGGLTCSVNHKQMRGICKRLERCTPGGSGHAHLSEVAASRRARRHAQGALQSQHIREAVRRNERGDRGLQRLLLDDARRKPQNGEARSVRLYRGARVPHGVGSCESIDIVALAFVICEHGSIRCKG